LPKTFQDTINICEWLGASYFWVDSSSIIQDSKEDQTIPSALMTQIYGNCNLTIAATSATNGSVGCFCDRLNAQVLSISEARIRT
ncbi:hypothetical protein M441DRAFT_149454, partial [Trichoderma asperellum CBS 433.97]